MDQFNDFYNKIITFEDDFYNKPITIVPGYDFSQYDAICRIHSYYSSRFIESSDEKRYFHNIVKDKVNDNVKNIDLDTKDFLIKSDNPKKDWLKSYLVQNKLKEVFKDIFLAEKLNEATKIFCKIGSLVEKKDEDSAVGFHVVDLRNLVCEPSARSLSESPVVIENHYLTESELLEKNAFWGSPNIKNIISFGKKKKSGTAREDDGNGSIGESEYINIKEVYSKVPASFFGGDSSASVLGKFYCYIDSGMRSDDAGSEYGWILYKKKITKEEFPYKEKHLDKIEGRWLGVGVVESLFDPQVRKNEIVNLRFQALRLAALAIFQTRDNTILRNILDDMANGDIMTMQDIFQRIPTEIREVSGYVAEENNVADNANKLANSMEITTGSELPSGTPYSLGALLDRNVNKYFDFIREGYGIFWESVIMDWLIPQNLNAINSEWIYSISDTEMARKISEEFAKAKVWGNIKNYVFSRGRVPSLEEFNSAVDMAGRNIMDKEMVLEIPEKFFSDFRYRFYFNSVNEEGDKRQQLITMSTIMEIIGKNPMILQNPITKRLLLSIMEISGVNPSAIFADESSLEMVPESEEPMLPVGGAAVSGKLPAVQIAGAASA